MEIKDEDKEAVYQSGHSVFGGTVHSMRQRGRHNHQHKGYLISVLKTAIKTFGTELLTPVWASHE